jgi:hypothetical protein
MTEPLRIKDEHHIEVICAYRCSSLGKICILAKKTFFEIALQLFT